MSKEMAKIYENMLKEYEKALELKRKKGDYRGIDAIQRKIIKIKRAMKRHSKKK